jgi:hypothetical protein
MILVMRLLSQRCEHSTDRRLPSEESVRATVGREPTATREIEEDSPIVAMPDLAAIEARLWSIFEPYRAELEASSIYGMPSLKWPGAKAHDYFVAVKPASRHVSVFLLVADTYPEALEGTSPELLRRRTGKSAFTFPSLDEDMARDLEGLAARLYERYRDAHVSR